MIEAKADFPALAEIDMSKRIIYSQKVMIILRIKDSIWPKNQSRGAR